MVTTFDRVLYYKLLEHKFWDLAMDTIIQLFTLQFVLATLTYCDLRAFTLSNDRNTTTAICIMYHTCTNFRGM